jgi:hypothetical protein
MAAAATAAATAPAQPAARAPSRAPSGAMALDISSLPSLERFDSQVCVCVFVWWCGVFACVWRRGCMQPLSCVCVCLCWIGGQPGRAAEQLAHGVAVASKQEVQQADVGRHAPCWHAPGSRALAPTPPRCSVVRAWACMACSLSRHNSSACLTCVHACICAPFSSPCCPRPAAQHSTRSALPAPAPSARVHARTVAAAAPAAQLVCVGITAVCVCVSPVCCVAQHASPSCDVRRATQRAAHTPLAGAWALVRTNTGSRAWCEHGWWSVPCANRVLVFPCVPRSLCARPPPPHTHTHCVSHV